jgi:hypothetical protein
MNGGRKGNSKRSVEGGESRNQGKLMNAIQGPHVNMKEMKEMNGMNIINEEKSENEIYMGEGEKTNDGEGTSSKLTKLHTFSYGGGSRCSTVLSSLYYSDKCKYFYLFMIIYNLILIIWTFADYANLPRIILFIICKYFFLLENKVLHIQEIVINVILIIDIIVRVCFIGIKKYCRNWINTLEILTMIGCGLCILITIYSYFNHSDLEQMTNQLLLIAISVVQYLRVVIFIKNTRENQVICNLFNYVSAS